MTETRTNNENGRSLNFSGLDSAAEVAVTLELLDLAEPSLQDGERENCGWLRHLIEHSNGIPRDCIQRYLIPLYNELETEQKNYIDKRIRNYQNRDVSATA